MITLNEVVANPSGWDSHRNYVGETEFPGWYVVLTRNRDSDLLAESNWEVALKMLGGESDTVCIHRFGHWACGWWEALCVLADSDAEITAVDIQRRMANYPVLDDEDYSRREWESALESWESWGASDFRKALLREWSVASMEDTRVADDIDVALDAVSDSALWQVYMDAADCPYEQDGGGTYFPDIDMVASNLDVADILPELIRDIKRERFARAADKFDDSVRWWWDDTVAFEL